MLKKLLFSICLLFSFKVQAQSSYKLVDLDQLNVSQEKFTERRYPYAPEVNDWEYRTILQIDVSALNSLYWNNSWHTETAHSTYKEAGWRWEAGLRLFPWMDVFQAHHSQHMLDQVEPISFPIENSYGIRIKFIEKSYSKNSLFN